MPMTPKQEQRQGHRENSGKYAKVNPCNVCARSAGLDYFSHGATDDTIGDELLVLCGTCAAKCATMSGPEAVAWASTQPKYWLRKAAARGDGVLEPSTLRANEEE
jgi:hypothetical protein